VVRPAPLDPPRRRRAAWTHKGLAPTPLQPAQAPCAGRCLDRSPPEAPTRAPEPRPRRVILPNDLVQDTGRSVTAHQPKGRPLGVPAPPHGGWRRRGRRQGCRTPLPRRRLGTRRAGLEGPAPPSGDSGAGRSVLGAPRRRSPWPTVPPAQVPTRSLSFRTWRTSKWFPAGPSSETRRPDMQSISASPGRSRRPGSGMGASRAALTAVGTSGDQRVPSCVLASA